MPPYHCRKAKLFKQNNGEIKSIVVYPPGGNRFYRLFKQ
jgi:hypothetical protein